MISLVVNDQTLQVDKNACLHQVLQLAAQCHSFDLANVAVAINQHIVPKSQWAQHCCHQDDQVDVFSAVAGG